MELLRIDMSLTDDFVHDLLWEKRNPRTNVTRMTLREISDVMGCHVNTAWRAIHRLESAGKIERLGKNRGRGGLKYRVIQKAG